MRYRILYFASLRDAAGCNAEEVESAHADARALYAELSERHRIGLSIARVRVAINGEFADWDRPLADGDEIAFLPPVSGG